MNSGFLKNNEQADLDHWKQLDTYTQRMYHWLPDLTNKFGKTYCLMNLSWPDSKIIDQLPLHYDKYVITFQFEYIDFDWVKRLCNTVAPRKVLLICPYNSFKYSCENLDLLEFQGWPQVIDWYQKEYGWPDVVFENKTKKLSSLCHRINQFRVYASAYIHQTWDTDDYLMTWHNWLGKPEDLYLFNPTSNSRINDVIDYLKNYFINLVHHSEQKFLNTPLANLDYNWSAYTDCLINSSNESVSTSFQMEGDQSCILPGPYLTEKTIKCLLSRTALLPAGQYNTYGYLESLGFKFDYPWNKQFDQIPQDLDRISGFFDTLDQINNMDFEQIKTEIKTSCDHNREYIISGDFLQAVNKLNEQNINQHACT